MQPFKPYSPNTNPQPREHIKLANVVSAAHPGVPKAEHIANQYQNNKDTVLNFGMFEHSKGNS